MGEHAGGALDQWLDDHACDLLFVAGEDPLQIVGIAGLGGMGLEEQRPVGGVEELDPADRYRADRVAVVGVAQVDEGGAAAMLATALLLELEGHLQRDLDRGRARLRVEDASQAGRGQLDQAACELSGARMREAEHRRVGDLLELGGDRGVDLRVTVAVHRAPERGDAVEVASPVACHEV